MKNSQSAFQLLLKKITSNILTKTRRIFAFLAGLESIFELKTLRKCKKIISV